MPDALRIPALLDCLEGHALVYVIVGSAAAMLYGVSCDPGDFDIVPATDPVNLGRLVRILRDLDARPKGPFGEWVVRAGGEWKWIPRPTTPEELAAWSPDPEDAGSMDHLFTTRLGAFDVVPRIAGTYEALRPRARRIPAGRHAPWVAHVDDLLARLTVPRREKDVPRVESLREIQRRLAGTDRHGLRDG